MRTVFPFSAIVGQDAMKRALLIAAVDPGIGGVMVFGDRGTGKSTAVRALAALLPAMRAVKDCPYHCDPEADAGRCTPDCPSRTAKGAVKAELRATPVVDLPQALTRGEKRFEPGLLAKAHRGFLYIDEVNLLEDHLVDLLLDVAASGENVVEREGLSVRHPARFVLIGTGNPEEGELRPQLLDRFGLSVDVKTPTVLADRVAVVRQRDAFDRDPETFAAAWTKKDAQVRDRIVKARAVHGNLALPDEVVECAAALCMKIGSDGLRGELTLIRAARALAALEGAKSVATSHLREIAVMSLQHRLRRNPLDDVGSASRIERALGEIFDA